MWTWVYRGMHVDAKRGRAVVQMRTDGHREPGQEKEWFEAQVEVEWHSGRSESATRLEALRRLRTLIDQEMRALGGPRDDAL